MKGVVLSGPNAFFFPQRQPDGDRLPGLAYSWATDSWIRSGATTPVRELMGAD